MPDTPDVDAKDWAIINGACADADLLRIQERGLNPRSNGAHRYRNAAHRQQAALTTLATLARKATPPVEGYDYATAWQNQCADNLAINAELEALTARNKELEAMCEWLADFLEYSFGYPEAELPAGMGCDDCARCPSAHQDECKPDAPMWLAAAREAVKR